LAYTQEGLGAGAGHENYVKNFLSFKNAMLEI
jgi:hypothetical protein